MWFRSDAGLFKCPTDVGAGAGAGAGTGTGADDSIEAEAVAFSAMWLKIILPCFLQAVGTAIGEVLTDCIHPDDINDIIILHIPPLTVPYRCHRT
jgi:hypothetical protein